MKLVLSFTSLMAGIAASAVAVANDQVNAVVWQATTTMGAVEQPALRTEVRQGHVLAEILRDRDIKSVAVTYSNSAYGKGLEAAFSAAYRAQGGTIAISISHQDGKTDYFAEMGALAVAGVDHLVVFGHLNRGGDGIIRTALDTGAFEKFVLGDAMIGEALVESIGDELTGSIATVPGSISVVVGDMAGEQRGTTEQTDNVIVTTTPGNLSGSVEITRSDVGVDLDNADDVKLTGIGNTSGAFRELEFIDGRFETVKIR